MGGRAYDRGMTESHLVLVANAGDGSISTFRLTDGSLERLAVTEGLNGCSTFAVDSARDLLYAGVKGEPAAVGRLPEDLAGQLVAAAKAQQNASPTVLKT